MMAFQVNSIAQLFATRIVDCFAEGTLITTFAALAMRVARRQDSGTRFAVWFAALMAIATTPLLSGPLGSQAGAARIDGHSAITVPGSWALYLFGAWAVIATWALVRVGIGLCHLHVLRRSCKRIDANLLDSQLQETLERNRTRPVDLCVSDRVHVPTAIGLVRPAVVLPGWVLQELSPSELNQVLLHELAHLRRWDDWTNLAQKVVKALFFFHPAVWWIEKKVSLEREMACDDAVLAETESPRSYAECLAHLAEKTLIQRSIALAQAALGRVRQTSQRVAQILDGNRPKRTKRAWTVGVPLVAGFAVVCVFAVSRAPRLIAFKDSAPSRAASPILAASVASADSGTVSIPVTRVGLRVPALAARSASGLGLKATGLKAKNTVSQGVRHAKTDGGKLVLAADVPSLPAWALVHPAKSVAVPMLSTDAVFVLVEGREVGISGDAVYEIRVWRVMVWHPVVDPSSVKIPRKET